MLCSGGNGRRHTGVDLNEPSARSLHGLGLDEPGRSASSGSYGLAPNAYGWGGGGSARLHGVGSKAWEQEEGDSRAREVASTDELVRILLFLSGISVVIDIKRGVTEYFGGAMVASRSSVRRMHFAALLTPNLGMSVGIFPHPQGGGKSVSLTWGRGRAKKGVGVWHRG